MKVNKAVLIGAALAAGAVGVAAAGSSAKASPGGAVAKPSDGPQIRIDPGHGGADPGAVAPNETTEKALNLAAALTLKFLLEGKGVDVSLTRSSDVRPDYSDRTKPGPEKIFVSLHHDTAATQNGYWVFYSDRPGSRELAAKLAAALEPFNGSQPVIVKDHNESRHGRLYIQDFRGVSVLVELGPTKAYGKDERVRRVGALVAPLMAFLKELEA